jgi:hypothetical protein
LSETTPAFNPSNADNQSNAANSTPEPQKPGVDLAPIVIAPSHSLWHLELAFYSGLVGAATIALFPFFLTAFYWPILWLLLALATGFVLRQRWHHKNSPPVCLSVQKNVWRLRNSSGEFVVEPFAEIVLWSGVIILPVCEILSGRQHRIIVMRDSVKLDDWRNLRVWLRTALRNNI